MPNPFGVFKKTRPAVLSLVTADDLNKTEERIRDHLRNMEKRIRERLLMTQQELTELLDKQTTQIGKVAKEQSDRYDALSAEIKRLQDIINAGGEITPELKAASDRVQVALDELDAAIPDAP